MKKFSRRRNNPVFNILRVKGDIKKNFPSFEINHKNNLLKVTYKVKPTDLSKEYLIKITFNGKENPKVFVLEPDIKPLINYPNEVHMFYDYSLCLFFNKKIFEFDPHNDVFSNTIIPWTSLWLNYFEIWLYSGEWLGGGVHVNKSTK